MQRVIRAVSTNAIKIIDPFSHQVGSSFQLTGCGEFWQAMRLEAGVLQQQFFVKVR